MSIKVDKEGFHITSDPVYGVEELMSCRQALYDLLGSSEEELPVETSYYGLMLLRMTEPSLDQWKKALDNTN